MVFTVDNLISYNLLLTSVFSKVGFPVKLCKLWYLKLYRDNDDEDKQNFIKISKKEHLVSLKLETTKIMNKKPTES